MIVDAWFALKFLWLISITCLCVQCIYNCVCVVYNVMLQDHLESINIYTKRFHKHAVYVEITQHMVSGHFPVFGRQIQFVRVSTF